jgi:hypothetical protein
MVGRSPSTSKRDHGQKPNPPATGYRLSGVESASWRCELNGRLPSSWDRWAALFEDNGYVALSPGWREVADKALAFVQRFT